METIERFERLRSLVAACHSSACAPPPAGTGGSIPGPSALRQYLDKMRAKPGKGVPGIYKVRVEHTDRSRGPAPGDHAREGAYNTKETEVEVEANDEMDAMHQAAAMVQSRIGEGMVLEQRVHSVKPHQAVRGNTSVVANDRSKIVKKTDTPAPGSDNPVAVRASRGESGTEPERRIPHAGETVDIYRDLGRGKEFKRGFPDKAAFSMRMASGADGNSSSLVTASTVGILLDNPRPAWANAAKAKAEVEGKRGVHAFIRGEVAEYIAPDDAKQRITEPGWQEVTYYPGTQDFFDPVTRRRFIRADRAIGVDGKFYVLGPEFHISTTPVSAIEKKIRASMTASAEGVPDDLELWEWVTEFGGEYDGGFLGAAERIERLRTLVAACHSEACAPPPAGTGGSLPGPSVKTFVPTVKKKGSTEVFVPTVKKKGSTAAPIAPTVKKKEAPAPPKPEPAPPTPKTQPMAPAPLPPERPTLTPAVEKASVSPVTTDLSGKSPSEIDTLLFPLWAKRWTVATRRHDYVERLEAHQQAVAGEWKPKSRFERSPIMAPYEIKQHEKKIAEYDAELADLRTQINPLEDEFNKRGGWERFDFVPDGHLHKRGCYTLFPTTERLILAEASGRDHKWIVDNYAYAACTVCFPDAPVQARDDYLRDRSNAKKGERAAKAAEKAAKQAEKNLVEPVRTQDSQWPEKIETVYAAKQWLKNFVEWTYWSKNDYHPSYQPGDADRVRHALVLKGITEEELAAMEAKWLKAVKRG